MSVGTNIKMLREQKSLTQGDLAAAAVCSVQAVSSWEQGKKTPHIRTIRALAEFFGVPAGALIDGGAEDITRLCLSDGETELLDVFRSVPEKDRALVLAMVKAAANEINL